MYALSALRAIVVWLNFNNDNVINQLGMHGVVVAKVSVSYKLFIFYNYISSYSILPLLLNVFPTVSELVEACMSFFKIIYKSFVISDCSEMQRMPFVFFEIFDL